MPNPLSPPPRNPARPALTDTGTAQSTAAATTAAPATTATASTTSAVDAPSSPPRPPVDADLVDGARTRAAHDPGARALQHRLVTAPGGATVAERRAQVQAVVDDVLRAHGSSEMLTAIDGPCLDIAAQWLPRLQAAGLPARIATVDPARRLMGGPPVRPGMEGKFHAFIAVGEPGQEPIIVDGSWRQFIAGAPGRTDLEPVLVGAHADVVRRFAREARALQVELYEDPLLGRREPGPTADLVYGGGAHAALRATLAP